MAATLHLQMFDDGDAALFGGPDLFGSGVQCIAGELELQVQSFDGTGDLAVGDSSAGKSFSLTKDSGGSSLSALAAADFGDDFMDNVSLDDLAAADHYGHTICGRQSTADSAAMAATCTGRDAGTGVSWNTAGAQPMRRSSTALLNDQQLEAHDLGARQQQNQAQESSDCDMSHTVGDGESSGVGPGKSVGLGSSHSEASEDNNAGVAPVAATRDEEHISMPSFGLSLSRLTNGSGQHYQPCAVPVPGNVQQLGTIAKPEQPEQVQQVVDLAQQKAPPAALPRAFSVDSFALAGGSALAACPEPNPAPCDGQRRAHVMRSFSYVAPDTLPMEFSLGCGDAGGQISLGVRGRCASLNETQLRRHWLHEGEFLAPRLPPSVSELELLELPEDAVPVQPSRGSLLEQQQPGSNLGLGASSVLSRPLGSGVMQLQGGSAAGGMQAGSSQAATVTVKRKIITSPSPLLQHPKQAKARQAGPVAGDGVAAKIQSPKRAKVGSGAAATPAGYGNWQEASTAASSAGMLAGWNPSGRQAGVGSSGSMKTVRSVPANMNSFLEGVEVTVQPLGAQGGVESAISPNSSAVSACTPHQPCTRSPLFETTGTAAAGRNAGTAPVVTHVIAPPVAKAGKSKAAAAGQQLSQATMVPSAGPGVMPGAFVTVGPDGKRFGPVPSVPKPRKRASPNGNPPKAPAPNPNGHCCTQCGTQTTPVWRAGPHGPKTLCNACGVRYMKVAKGNVAPTPRRQQH